MPWSSGEYVSTTMSITGSTVNLSKAYNWISLLDHRRPCSDLQCYLGPFLSRLRQNRISQRTPRRSYQNCHYHRQRWQGVAHSLRVQSAIGLWIVCKRNPFPRRSLRGPVHSVLALVNGRHPRHLLVARLLSYLPQSRARGYACGFA